MDVPRLLAIDNVHIAAPHGTNEAIRDFYVGLLGFEPLARESDDGRLALRGYPRSGPRIIIEWQETAVAEAVRRRAQVQVASLTELAEVLADRGMWHEWSSGWFRFDRRLNTLDPAGHWIELVAAHPL